MLVYIAGYVAYRFKHKYNLDDPTKILNRNKTPALLEFVSRWNLLYQNDGLLETTKALVVEFYKMYGIFTSSEKKMFTNRTNKTLAKLNNPLVLMRWFTIWVEQEPIFKYVI